jgi:hypothetical protein
VRVRVLPREEWPRILDADALETPFQAYGLPQGDGWRILVAETAEGRIVALSCLYDTVHWDGWFVAPAHRGNPSIIRQMLRVGRAELREHDIQGVFALVAENQTDAYRAMIERLGFRQAGGALYVLVVDDLPKGL